MSPRRLMAGYGLLVATLVGGFAAIPGLHVVSWILLGGSATVAVLVGARRYRPRSRTPWLLMAAALGLFTGGHLAFGSPRSFPSVASVLCLTMYPLIVAGLLRLPRLATGKDRAGLIDVLILSAGLALLSWIFLISPYVESPRLSTAYKAASIAYPVCDVIFVALAARLLSAFRRTPTVALMAAGALGLIASDVGYGLAQLHGDWTAGPIDLGWAVFCAAWGAAALHPSMTALTEPRVVPDSDVSNVRFGVLTVSALVAPAVLWIEATVGTVHDGRVIALMSAVIFLLVLVRLASVVSVYRHATARERALREAGAALVSASDPDEVAEAVRTAVGRLLPAGTYHHLVLEIARPDAVPDEEAVARSPAPAGVAGPRFVPTAELAGERKDRLGEFEMALLQPLTLKVPPYEERVVGSLLLSTGGAALLSLSSAVEVLASQAALALDRIGLTAEVTRRTSEEYFRTLVHNTADVILIVGDDNTIGYASPSATGVFGPEPLLGRDLIERVDPRRREMAAQMLDLMRAGNRPPGTADWIVRDGGDQPVQIEVSCRDLRQDPTIQGLVLTLRDVTAQRRLEKELVHAAFHDSLTGLPNRMLFQDRVQHAVAQAGRSGAVVGVLFIDLDDFKVVNDTLGHEVGDQVLVTVAEKLSAALRPHDTAARLGGDEFAVLIDDSREPHDVEQVAERLVATIGEPLILSGSLINTSVSVGVATTTEAAAGSDLLRQADMALYVAKGNGKGQWRRYQSALHTAIVQRLELRSELEQAVTDGALAVQYQPIVALRDGTTVGFEALVRWRHPQRGLLPPATFIEVAEDSGLIVRIGDWVLHRAILDAAGWSGIAGDPQPYVSINVSARQFRTPGFIEKILEELASAELPPRRLMLEITESLLLRDDEQVWTDLAALRNIGVRVAIDDFGTGYSSLSYLRQTAVDLIKIDKSFTDTMAASEQQRAMVDCIVRLAHVLGLSVIAEGIETAADRGLLVDLGCPYGQGYLFSVPLDNADVAGWSLAQAGRALST